MCRVMCLRVQVVPHGSLHELTLMDGVLCGETSLDRPGTLSENKGERERVVVQTVRPKSRGLNPSADRLK